MNFDFGSVGAFLAVAVLIIIVLKMFGKGG